MTFEQIMQSEKFVPNMEQRPVIESVRNTVVSAGAGAGKTAVLSWRFLRLVMEEKVRPDQILTLTFTKKAANEMRQRIYQRLIKAKDSIPQDSLDSFRRATISTLDSFCAQIVRSDSISYGFSRDMGNLSEEDLSDMAQRLAQGFLSDPDNREESSLLASLDMPPAIMNGFFLTIASKVSLAGNYNADRISRDFVETVREVYLAKRTRLGELLDRLGSMALGGAFASQYVKPFADAMVGLKKGEISSEPVKTDFGYHIIQLEDVRDAVPPAFEDVKPQIEERLQQKRVTEFVQSIESKAEVK